MQDNFVHTDLHPGNILVRTADPTDPAAPLQVRSALHCVYCVCCVVSVQLAAAWLLVMRACMQL